MRLADAGLAAIEFYGAEFRQRPLPARRAHSNGEVRRAKGEYSRLPSSAQPSAVWGALRRSARTASRSTRPWRAGAAKGPVTRTWPKSWSSGAPGTLRALVPGISFHATFGRAPNPLAR